MSADPIEGQLFIRNYIRPPDKLDDSKRARRRFLHIVREIDYKVAEIFAKSVLRRLGVPYQYLGGANYDHRKFFEECSVEDFLSAITLLITASPNPVPILAESRAILAEEHLRYRLDDKGGVHYLVDEQFERNVQSALEGLGLAKFVGARHAFEEALGELAGPKPSGKAVIRHVFEAVESMFLVLADHKKVDLINPQAIDDHLKPLLLKKYQGMSEVEDRVDRLLTMLKNWVKAAHPFRHGAKFADVHEAPMDYATLIADQGLAHIRMLATL